MNMWWIVILGVQGDLIGSETLDRWHRIVCRNMWQIMPIFNRLMSGGEFSSPRKGRTSKAAPCDLPCHILGHAGTYQLRRLRLHGLIERLPNSFRYRVTDFGFRAALFFTRLYNRLLRPGIAAAIPGLRAVDSSLKHAFDKIDAHVNTWIKQAQFAT